MVTGKMVAALRKIGFDKVFDTNFGADMTIMEEANEFVKRIEKNKNLPLITSCCPSWIRFAEETYPFLLKNISACKSPQQMFGVIAALYEQDKKMKVRVASHNPAIKKIYKEFLGKPLEKKSEKLLQTKYKKRKPKYF